MKSYSKDFGKVIHTRLLNKKFDKEMKENLFQRRKERKLKTMINMFEKTLNHRLINLLILCNKVLIFKSQISLLIHIEKLKDIDFFREFLMEK